MTLPRPRPRLTTARVGTCLVLLGCAALLAARWDEPLWLDEAWTIEDLVGVRTMHVGVQVRERFYEGLLRVWLGVCGLSLASVRAFPAAFGLLALVVTARAARRGGGDPFSAVMVLGGLPLALHFFSELNRYAPLTFLAACSIWALLEAGAAVRPRMWAAAGAAGLLAFFVHHTAAFTVLLVQAGVLLVQRLEAPPAQRRARTLALVLVPAAQLLVLLVVELPWILARAALYRAEQEDVYAHVYKGPSPEAVLELLRQLSPGQGGGPLLVGAGLSLLGLLVVAGAGGALRRGRPLLLLAAGPFLGAALGSLVQPMFLARVTLPAAPALALLAARAWPDRPRTRRGVAASLLLLGWWSAARSPWPEDARGALQALASAEPRPGEGLIVQPPFARTTLRANERLGSAWLPLTDLPLDAPTALQAARYPWAGCPRRVFVVLQDFRGFAEPLARELPLHFAEVRELGRSWPFQVLLCERPLTPAEALARADAHADERAGVVAFRRGCVRLHAGQPAAALVELRAARQALLAAPDPDPRRARDDAGQAAWAVAWAAHLAGHTAEARAALDDAQRLGVVPAPGAAAAIRGE